VDAVGLGRSRSTCAQTRRETLAHAQRQTSRKRINAQWCAKCVLWMCKGPRSCRQLLSPTANTKPVCSAQRSFTKAQHGLPIYYQHDGRKCTIERLNKNASSEEAEHPYNWVEKNFVRRDTLLSVQELPAFRLGARRLCSPTVLDRGEPNSWVFIGRPLHFLQRSTVMLRARMTPLVNDQVRMGAAQIQKSHLHCYNIFVLEDRFCSRVHTLVLRHICLIQCDIAERVPW
jgi:hypothetical protein